MIVPDQSPFPFLSLPISTVIFCLSLYETPHLVPPFSFPLGTVLTQLELLFMLEPLGLRPKVFSSFFSLLMSTFSLLIAFLFPKSYRLPFLAIQNVLLPPTSSLSVSRRITASVSYLVSCIFGAESLILYVVTRFLTDGCFQAHCQVVFGTPLPFALSMKFETLSINLGCFPLNVQYLSTAVGLRSLSVFSTFSTIQFTVYTGSVHFDMPSLVQSFTLLQF